MGVGFMVCRSVVVTAVTKDFGGFIGSYVHEEQFAIKSIGYDEETGEFKFSLAWKTSCKNSHSSELVEARVENRKIMIMSIIILIFDLTEVRYSEEGGYSDDILFKHKNSKLDHECIDNFFIDETLAQRFGLHGFRSTYWFPDEPIPIPSFIKDVFENYFNLPTELKKAFINSCYIVCQASDFVFTNRNLSIMLSMTAIEGLVTADFVCKNGSGEERAIRKTKYIGEYVGKLIKPKDVNSKKRKAVKEDFRKLYEQRSVFVHNAEIFEADMFVTPGWEFIHPDDIYRDSIFAFGLSRLCLFNWLCHPERKPEINVGESGYIAVTNRELIDIYVNAKYVVTTKNTAFRLKVGFHSPEADRLLDLHELKYAYFITPENPFSQSLSEAENKLRHQRFVHLLDDNKLSYIEGYGTDDDEDDAWGREYSYLIFCENSEMMCKLAASFGQKGILRVSKNNPVSLLTLEDMRYRELG
jgi:hypothetical protein